MLADVITKIENCETMHVAATTEVVNLSEAIITKIRQGFRVQILASGDEALGQMTKALSRSHRKLRQKSGVIIAWFSEELLSPEKKSSAITTIVILNYFRPPLEGQTNEAPKHP